jgi:hypothetical protein
MTDIISDAEKLVSHNLKLTFSCGLICVSYPLALQTLLSWPYPAMWMALGDEDFGNNQV